jgi:hypothetical protein
MFPAVEQRVRYVVDAAVATITMDDGKVNVLSSAMRRERGETAVSMPGAAFDLAGWTCPG